MDIRVEIIQMAKIVSSFIGVFMFCTLGLYPAAAVIPLPDEELSSYLPQSDEVKGWSRNEAFEEYKGEDLFFYINGGAEIYHEYGFERVIVQDYQNKNGKSASLEIYEMTDPSSAYGMYSFKSGGEGEGLDLGAGGKLQDYYLNFWKGKYLITITGFDEDAETIQGLQSLAKVTDTRIAPGERSEHPSLVKWLPKDGLKPHEVTYFQGNLGLFNSYPFTTKGLLKVTEAVKGTYGGGYDIYIILYNTEHMSDEVFQSAGEGLPHESRYKSVEAKNGTLELIDEKGTLILIQPSKNYLIIVLGTESFDSAQQIAADLRSHIRNL